MSSDNPEIREFYNNYQPPRYALRTVKKLLYSVPAKYLDGLDCVVLTNQSGQPRRIRLGKVTSRKRRLPQSQVLGKYHPAGRAGQLPWIELFVDNLAAGTDASGHGWLPFIRYACFGLVLFHEIGHHIHATITPEHREKEDVADDWGKKLLRSFIRRKYWYLAPIRKPLGRFLKEWSKSLD